MAHKLGIESMLRYAAAPSRYEICHNTAFELRGETVALAGREYVIVTCSRCGRTGLPDLRVLKSKSKGAPVETA